MLLSDRLRELRTQIDVTQTEIAELLNIDRSTYGNYETGDSCPDFDKLIKLSAYFNVSTDYLLGKTNTG